VITALVIANVVLALLVLIELGALSELFKQVQQIRSHLRLDDLPVAFPLQQTGLLASSSGLPVEIDAEGSAVVLFLSPNCITCRQLGLSLMSGPSSLTDHLWVLIEPVFDHSAEEFVSQYEIRERFMIDINHSVADSLGVDTTPLALIIENGRVKTAMTVPSPRQLGKILKEGSLVQLKPA
jgi:thiol-disulfide isomerase/thioredoxin